MPICSCICARIGSGMPPADSIASRRAAPTAFCIPAEACCALDTSPLRRDTSSVCQTNSTIHTHSASTSPGLTRKRAVPHASSAELFLSQVEWSEALLLHTPEAITVNMAAWRGHFGTLMPFYVACEKAGGFVGSAQRAVAAPAAVPGAAEEACADDLAAAGAVPLPELQLYAPPTRADGSVVDWGAPIRCVAARPALAACLWHGSGVTRMWGHCSAVVLTSRCAGGPVRAPADVAYMIASLNRSDDELQGFVRPCLGGCAAGLLIPWWYCTRMVFRLSMFDSTPMQVVTVFYHAMAQAHGVCSAVHAERPGR